MVVTVVDGWEHHQTNQWRFCSPVRASEVDLCSLEEGSNGTIDRRPVQRAMGKRSLSFLCFWLETEGTSNTMFSPALPLGARTKNSIEHAMACPTCSRPHLSDAAARHELRKPWAHLS